MSKRSFLLITAAYLLFFPQLGFADSAERPPSSLPPTAKVYPIDSPMEGPQSIYTPLLVDLLKSWPPKDIDYRIADTENTIRVNRLDTPSNEFYIGAEQVMYVDAAISRVETIVDDIDHFKDIFTDFEDVHIAGRDQNKLNVYWELSPPFFFLPNIKYYTLYLLDKTDSKHLVYRYKLKQATDDMNFSDGVVVLEKAGEMRTRFTEYDFWDSNYGILKTLAPRRIWKDSIEDLYLSDAAVKLRCEHPEWSQQKVTDESKKMLAGFPLEETLDKGKTFYLLGRKQ